MNRLGNGCKSGNEVTPEKSAGTSDENRLVRVSHQVRPLVCLNMTDSFRGVHENGDASVPVTVCQYVTSDEGEYALPLVLPAAHSSMRHNSHSLHAHALLSQGPLTFV